MSIAKEIVMMIDEVKAKKPRLSIRELIGGQKKLFGRQPHQDRNVKIYKMRPSPGTNWIRFDASSTGRQNTKYDLTMIFYDVDFSKKKDAEHPVKVEYKPARGPTQVIWMEYLDEDDHPVAVYCSCSDFRFRWSWWLREIGSLAAGRKPIPYTRKTKTRPPVNPQEIKGVCKHLYMATLELKKRGIMK